MVHQRDAGVAQRVEAGADGEASDHVQRGQSLGWHSELGLQLQRAAAAGEADHLIRIVDELERAGAVLAFDHAGDVLVDHRLAEARRDYVDEALAAQQPGHVVFVEDARAAGEAERRAGDDHRGATRAFDGGRAGGPYRARYHGSGCAEPSGVQAAQRLVERHGVRQLGMIGRQREHLWQMPQRVVGQPGERALGPNLDQGADAIGVEALEPLDELHRRRDLARQQVEHLGACAFVAGVRLARHVGDHRQTRRPHV